MVDKNKIKKMYLDGYNASQIAKAVYSTKAAVQKYIQRNLSNYKTEHINAVFNRKQALKAVNYEANKFISDRSFILKNRSIYRTASDGDIILNKSIAGVVTWDTPRRLVNENKYA